MIFKGLLIKKNEDETISCNIEELKINNNEELDTLVEISCSTVNYKDSLAISGKPGIIRTYPMVPGIDFSGKVVDTKSSLFKSLRTFLYVNCFTLNILRKNSYTHVLP